MAPQTNGIGTFTPPDPTADLHWSEYLGAIHEIFDRNAQSHPDRICVVETPSENAPQREFSYRQINEASNILAHHFLDHGLKRGEVVMIFAHRNVDLVVAIMGTLKAGGTFSVLDPQYPPDRQIIYLDVSRPSVLVEIERASQEAGQLSPQVRDWIAQNLRLRTSIPSLMLQDDGSLSGGNVNSATDCLSEQQPRASVFPDVVVGPDSTPTLSFTSGSEGRPKGVRGRHYSLAYYFPWMSESFNLSQTDRFTMLSGIAHDPIQRDIFTPLFLGAQLLVPSREDIQHDRLADWMRKYGATVTHLTPAMGQILVTAKSQFPTLHHAFFVGDVLPKRDCRRLQALAPNCRIVNMYGTTETQRAVSYFELPSHAEDPAFLDSQPERIPAGRGMKDVQLLVVDRENPHRICGVNEQGEIYVRAAGLAEGYLGDDGLTSKKFVPNWFVDNEKWVKEDAQRVHDQGQRQPWRKFFFGPRDRLYRSGDLGRYMSNGNVECTGRVDNQIKIRGFRIELGEIDKYISEMPLIRENCTLVRRDPNEEQTLVSYIVPNITFAESDDVSMVAMLRRFGPLRSDVREYLKGKLPSYAVPTTFVPLAQFPLNPNGKIDKNKLPYPEPEEMMAAHRRPSQEFAKLSPTESELSKIWKNGVKRAAWLRIQPEDHFYDIGGDSLNAHIIIKGIKQAFPHSSVTLRTLLRNPSLQSLASEIDTVKVNGASVNGSFDREVDYAEDARRLANTLPMNFEQPSFGPRGKISVFLTGATGFLGAYLIRELLKRPNISLTVHVRTHQSPFANSHAAAPVENGANDIAVEDEDDAEEPRSDKIIDEALQRVVNNCQSYGIWSDAWYGRLHAVQGDLRKPNLGLSRANFSSIQQSDVIIHNGARVHWLDSYEQLKAENVLSTLATLALCSEGKPKSYGFVSSTSVLDSPHFVSLAKQNQSISEDDDLQGSQSGLSNGYGQTKWVSEFLVRECGRRGLRGSIIRPGYILGDSNTGACVTDDFLIRLLKGCVQLKLAPEMSNLINMVPVDHVASIVTAASLNSSSASLSVAQVDAHPRIAFTEFLGSLSYYGYNVQKVDYGSWKQALESYVERASNDNAVEQHALLPLFHWVTSDLPADTLQPSLSDRNTVMALQRDAKAFQTDDRSGGSSISRDTIGLYLHYLVTTGFLPKPLESAAATPLPSLPPLSESQQAALKSAGGRGASR